MTMQIGEIVDTLLGPEGYVELSRSGLPPEAEVSAIQLIFTPDYEKPLDPSALLMIFSFGDNPIGKSEVEALVHRAGEACCKQVLFVDCYLSHTVLLFCAEHQMEFLHLASVHHAEHNWTAPAGLRPDMAKSVILDVRRNFEALLEHNRLTTAQLVSALFFLLHCPCVAIQPSDDVLAGYVPGDDLHPLFQVVSCHEKEHLLSDRCGPLIHLPQLCRGYDGCIIRYAKYSHIYVFIHIPPEYPEEAAESIRNLVWYFYFALCPADTSQRTPSNPEDLMLSIIFDGMTDKQEIQRCARSMNFPLASYYYLWLLNIQSDQQNFSTFNFSLARSLISKYIPGSTTFFRTNKAITVTENRFIPIDQLSSAFQKLMAELRIRFREYQFTLAFSRSYPSLCEMSSAYEEALFSLRFKQHLYYPSSQNQIPFYNSQLLPHFVYDQMNNPVMQRMYDSTLALILQYDKDNQDSLFATCRSLIRNNFNQIDTAQELYIHRNTLRQRIGRIEVILNASCSDIVTRSLLLISSIFYDIQKQIESEK